MENVMFHLNITSQKAKELKNNGKILFYDYSRKQYYIDKYDNFFDKWIPKFCFDNFSFPIDLIPETCFGSNLRDHISADDWKIIRTDLYKQNSYFCEICGQKGPNHPVEAHELWSYENNIQKMIGLLCLCPACHETQHFGLAMVNGRYEETKKHYAWLCNISENKAEEIFKKSFSVWQIRSQKEWKLDLSWIKTNYSTIKLISTERMV